MMKKRIRLFALLLTCALLLGCAEKQSFGVAEKTQTPDGYTPIGTQLRGGIPLEQANLRSLTGFVEDGELCLRLSFVQGSRLSGSEDEKALLSIPAYEIYLLDTPYRLVIELPALAYWDYTRTADFEGFSDIDGYFQHILSDGDTVSVFIQLNRACAFRIDETDGELVVRMRMEEKKQARSEDGIADVMESDTHYYAVADLYREYCNAAISREMDMLPTLTLGEDHIVLISKPFDTPMEAESYKKKTSALTAGSVESQWYTAQIKDGELPTYSSDMDLKAVHEQNICRINGEEQLGKVFLEDGLYLCTLPEKNGVLYTKRITDDEITGDSYSYEQLYTMDLTGKKKRLFPYEFETVESAAYSPDGRKLAVLERAAESTHLYVFDVEAKEMLVDLTEVGFGDMVSAYTWDALGSAIYAVSGSGNMQLHQYDFNVPDEAKRYSLVDKNGADEADIAYCDGNLYFVETDMNEGAIIYRIKPGGGVRKVFAKGANFVLSPDNRYMAINNAAGDFEASDQKNIFRIMNMETGLFEDVTDAFSVYSFFWSRDCTKLYYFENRLSGSANEEEGTDSATQESEQDSYPYTLWVYDLLEKKSRALMDLPTTQLLMSGLSDKFYINYLDQETMGSLVRACYEISAVQ